MDEVLINLQSIKDLRVPGRTSVEQYRNNVTKSIPEIAKELGVNYIVEGSGQKYGNTFRLRVQLVEGTKDRHLWGESYEQEIEEVRDIFSIQSHIAQAIAKELKAIITPEEKQLIEKTPTTSLTAFDFFQRGREEHWKYWLYYDRKALKEAQDLYNEALQYDSSFAQAYTGLAWAYWDKHFWEDILSEKYQDSVMILCDIALSYDDQLSEAYYLRGKYYDQILKQDQALEEFDKAIKFNPNDWMAYKARGDAYYNYFDMVNVLENYQKAISLSHGPQLPGLLRSMGEAYLEAGFIEKANYYLLEALKLDKDSMTYLGWSANFAGYSGNLEKNLEIHKKYFEMDSSNIDSYFYFGLVYSFNRQHEEALRYIKKWLEKRGKTLSAVDFFGLHRIGWAYWKNGYKKEGEYYFNELINYCERLKKMQRYYPARSSYDLAAAYSFTGNKEKAYENLILFSKYPRSNQLWWINYLKFDPLFDPIRNEPEFQQILRDMVAVNQAEHERVRKWLEEQGML
jgi:tetratricopeptide (TPR) repeat protein